MTTVTLSLFIGIVPLMVPAYLELLHKIRIQKSKTITKEVCRSKFLLKNEI